jgi:hypothetical protein
MPRATSTAATLEVMPLVPFENLRDQVRCCEAARHGHETAGHVNAAIAGEIEARDRGLQEGRQGNRSPGGHGHGARGQGGRIGELERALLHRRRAGERVGLIEHERARTRLQHRQRA